VHNNHERSYIESHVNNLPNNLCEMTVYKQMLCRLILLTKTTLG
jgi:hypothetical protein